MTIAATKMQSDNLTTARRRPYLSMSPQRAQRLANTDMGCQQDRQWITMTIGFPSDQQKSRSEAYASLRRCH
jgi:hypothetical protein